MILPQPPTSSRWGKRAGLGGPRPTLLALESGEFRSMRLGTDAIQGSLAGSPGADHFCPSSPTDPTPVAGPAGLRDYDRWWEGGALDLVS